MSAPVSKPMVKFPKAVRGDYWWDAQGEVVIDVGSVESVEQMYDRTPGGSPSVAYVLITMKSGVQHKVYEFLSKVQEALGVSA